MKIGFLGAGKMATAIACGLVREHVVTADQLLAGEKLPAARAAFTARTGAATTDDNAAVVTAADTVILAVKPQDAALALAPLQGRFAGKLLISIAAGLPLAKLAGLSGAERLIRVMPNTPAMVNRGATVFACAPGATAADREQARRIFGAVGQVWEMDESRLDAVTAVSGSGPAYVFAFIEALVAAAVEQGLPAEAALALTVQTVAGAAEMLQQGQGTPAELRQAVTSKGGTTAAGLQVLQDGQFNDLIARMVAAACRRAGELGRQA